MGMREYVLQRTGRNALLLEEHKQDMSEGKERRGRWA